MSGFPNVIAVIDYAYIEIQTPREDDKLLFFLIIKLKSPSWHWQMLFCNCLGVSFIHSLFKQGTDYKTEEYAISVRMHTQLSFILCFIIHISPNFTLNTYVTLMTADSPDKPAGCAEKGFSKRVYL